MKLKLADYILTLVFTLMIAFWVAYAILGEALFALWFKNIPYGLYLLLSFSNYLMLLGILIYIKLSAHHE